MSIESDLLNLILKEFRESDGTGNNLANDSWGSAGETLTRLTFADYADSISAPEDRGNARVISNAMADIPGGTANSFGTSELFIFFGQYIDHDLDLVFEDPAAGHMSTTVPVGDPAFPPGSILELDRSMVVSGTGTGAIAREHANQITSFLDASNVYGSSQATTNVLRDGAYMITNANGGAATVADIEAEHGAGSADGLYIGNPATAHVMGDIRSDENIALTSMHQIWMREHNYQVDRLRDLDPTLTDEEAFQMARIIVEAEYQKVIYEEWLPELIGQSLPGYNGYRNDVDPTISNEFAGAGFRFGHTMLPTEFERLAEDGTVTEQLGLFDAFFQPHKLDLNGGVAALVRGLAADTASEFDAKIIDDVRNLLFGPNSFRDLATLNIMRGRDQGVTTLNDFRADFNNSPALLPYTSFSQLTSDTVLANALSAAYGGDINKVDLWVGILAEDKVGGLQVGETLQAILVDQFSRLRDGDRFYYENRLAESPDLLAQIENTTFSEIIKRNTGIEHLQQEVFKAYGRMAGDSAANEIIGGDGSELIFGEQGSDTLRGGGSRDEMYGGADDDDMFGDGGHDIMYGDDGNDFMMGGSGNDHAEGGHGNDWIFLGTGHDYAQGEAGHDTIRGGAHSDIIGGGHGDDRLFGDSQNDEIYGDSGHDRLFGGQGHDLIFGGHGADKIFGGTHHDKAYGGAGRDHIHGNQGNDLIDGEEGRDFLWGGAGRDKFVMGHDMGFDLIFDFNEHQDKLAVGAHFSTVQEVYNNAHDTNRGAIIKFSSTEKVLLIGISVSDLHAGNFDFDHS
ncbi:MAG: peroxidase [Alphaproteobacteria bacterium]|nr:peroxidase [Alphaproteobacteria bacterium]